MSEVRAELHQRGDAWEPAGGPLSGEADDDPWYTGGQGRPLPVQSREDFQRHPPLPRARRSRPPQVAGPLDKNTNRVSESDRARRYWLRDGLREITTIPRIAKCGHVHIDRLPSVHLVKDEDGATRYQGVLTCGNVWGCPECGARLSRLRAKKLTNYVTGWMRNGGQVLFLTLTMPHDFQDTLDASCSTMQKAFTRILSGRCWQDLKSRYGIRGFVRALEVTLGGHGWHPHMHILFFLERRLNPDKVESLHTALFEIHSQFVTRAGFRAPDIRNCPLKVVAHERVGEYVGKVSAAHELVSSHTKQARLGGRTPFQLLADVLEHGDAADLARWHEWERVMHGRRQLTWSRGMEATLAALAVDLLEEERGRRKMVLVALISRPLWARICRARGLAALLLDVVEHCGYETGLALLRRTVGQDLPDLARSHFVQADSVANAMGPP